MPVRKHTDNNPLIAFIIYYLIWLILIAASLYPDKRWWAFSVYAYVDELSRYLIFPIAGIVPIILFFIKGKINMEADDLESSSSKYFVGSLLIFISLVVLSIIFRAQVFYLGDGYTLLSTLASDNPIMKQREIGESLIHLWVRDIFGNGETAALLSYQTISIYTGATLLLFIIMFSKRMFNSLFNRLIFILIFATGGYALLWFGYIENYSLFVMSVGAYSFVGYLAVNEKISHYWIIIPLVLAIIMHVMGVTLIPSAIFILLTRPGPNEILSRFTKLTKGIFGIIVFIILMVLFVYVYNNSYFFKLALVPIIENRFTVDGYTLFSFAHLMDIFNLIVLLVPCSIITIAYLINNKNKVLPISIRAWFLIILTVSVFIAAFLFDPKIGMPRDWDLFSFAGVPLMLLCLLSLFYLLKKEIISRTVLILALSLNLMFLIPRVFTQTSQDLALEQFQQYISWDPLKSRNAMTMLVEHYTKDGDTVQVSIEIEKWRVNYPEWQQNRIAMKMTNDGYINEAINIYKDIIRINPIYSAAYCNLGLSYMKQMNLDSAGVYLGIAEGMNPYNHRVLANLGMYHFYKENYSKAEKLFKRALDRDTLISTAVIGLLNVYKMRNEREKYYKYLSRVVWYKEASLEYSKEMGEYYLSLGNFDDAARVYNDAIKNKGLDSLYIKNLKAKYPQLKIE